MSETAEELKDAGTWYCGKCKQPVTVSIVQNKLNHFKIQASCPAKHSLKFIIESPYLVYLDEAGLRKLAEAFMIAQTHSLGEKNAKMYRAVLCKAMQSVSGLSEKICEQIIDKGYQDDSVRCAQKPVREMVCKGKNIIYQEVTIDEEE